MRRWNKKSLWGLVGLGAVACFVTMCIPTVIAILGGGYLIASGNYGVAALLVAAAIAAGYGVHRRGGIHQRPTAPADPTPTSAHPAARDNHPAPVSGAPSKRP